MLKSLEHHRDQSDQTADERNLSPGRYLVINSEVTKQRKPIEELQKECRDIVQSMIKELDEQYSEYLKNGTDFSNRAICNRTLAIKLKKYIISKNAEKPTTNVGNSDKFVL